MNEFLKEHTCYDVLPISFRLVVFDTHLPVKKALSMLIQNGKGLLFLHTFFFHANNNVSS